MSFRHVEDTEAPSDWRRCPTEHSVWRCVHCRALCVTQKGSKPPEKCGKCKL